MASSVAASMPVITTVPRIRRAAAPDPVAIHSGTQPRMKANDVIRIGRSRSARAFERGVDQIACPARARLRELDDQDRVLRREADQHDEADLRVHVESKPRSSSPRKAPNTATGTDSSTLNGSDQLS